MEKAKIVHTPREDSEIVEDIIEKVRERIGIKLFRKELWNLLLEDSDSLAELVIANLNKKTETKIKLVK